MLELFRDAGWVAYPLGICSILALAIILERLWVLARLRQVEDRAFQELQTTLRRGNGDAAFPGAIAEAPDGSIWVVEDGEGAKLRKLTPKS